MSRAIYSRYTLEEKEKKRLEKERKRRLEEERKRQEEARKQELERRRREKAEQEEKERRRREEAERKERERRQKDIEHRRQVELQEENNVLDALRDLQEMASSLDQQVVSYHKNEQIPSHEAIQAIKTLEELIVQLQVVRVRALLEEHRENAALLIDSLDSLAREDSPDRIVSDLPELHKKALDLYHEFEKSVERDQKRRVVLQNTQEVLAELGYKVLDLEEERTEEKAETGGEPLSLYFRTPEKGVIRLGCGLDSSLFSEFIQLKKKGGDEPAGEALEHKCKQWCRDYDFLLYELSSRNIQIEENWREAPVAKHCRVIEVSEEYLKTAERVAPSVSTMRKNSQNS